MEPLFNYEERLVRFAGEVVFFIKTIPKTYEGKYYSDQLIRSSGGSALNYGEAQGTITRKDFINKMSLVVKELKESRCSLKILRYTGIGKNDKGAWLLVECEELIAIGSKMINNKRE
ncbi:four helix bundle protein [Flavilitoribacter nigricans]|uniref:Four helix bundle protein n=1 Tax=Flavilitoribacter nigricans (strain ATCC 23147 / DSM 23189 / NBRC 102662 / NCIMB 1420 / SS-2) TaxID=1122177 RepID=A0A2D0N9M4_FLAN2|nr:four helix bundle protein [Flavilitoribacter nigricans]PHN05185.1 four helix bundle protein [Flavilitoribacter nigricans DSM 23189 = NBRC 102662]